MQIVVRLGDRTSRRLPRTWTDVDGPPQHITDTMFIADALRARFDRVDGPPQHITATIFTVDALRARLDRVDTLRVSDRR